jgi:4-hydroxybenzoate polyprenyltransferase
MDRKKNKTKIHDFFSLVKFSHTIFAMPFALIGFFLATTDLLNHWKIFILVIICMVFARNAAMGFNRYLDREIDLKNPRTAIREIPTKKITPYAAILFIVGNIVLFITTTFFINTLVFFLSPVALAVILGYSYTKRFTFFSHFILGLGLSLAPIGGYLSVNGYFSLIPCIYSLVVVFWVSGFDIIYALQDIEFDRNENLKSIPVVFDRNGALFLSAIVHFFAASLVITAGIIGQFHLLYWIGSAIFIGLLFYQHYILKPNDLSRLNVAFFTTNGIASVIFAIFTILSFVL